MEHFRLRKYRGADVWARVQEAYVAGEPGPQVARRFDVGLANLRKKARREGWTRTAVAARTDPLILATQPRRLGDGPEAAVATAADPGAARAGAIDRAAALLGAGRAAEAMTLLKAAEALGRIVGDRADAPPAEPAPPTAEEAAAKRAADKAVMDAVHQQVWDWAEKLALDLLTDRGPPEAAYGAWAWRWRAWVLGPEVALSDFRAGVHGGWADRYWDAEGRLLEVDPIPPRPDLLMVTQHLRHCQGVTWGQEDLTGWRWPPRDWWGDEAEGEGVVEPVERGPRIRRV